MCLIWIALLSVGSTTPRVSAEQPERSQRVLDVRDILAEGAAARDFTSPLTVDRADGRVVRSELEEEAAGLQELVERFIEPTLERDRDRVEVTSGGSLVATLTADRHAWLDRFLDEQRRTPGMADIQFQFVAGPRGAFDELVVSANARGEISKQQADLLTTRGRAGGMFEIVHSPRMVVLPRQKASMSVLDEVAYVKDWTIEVVEPGHQTIAAPQVDVAQDGIAVDLRAVALADGRVGAYLEIAQAELERPIATTKVRLPMDPPREVEIARPAVTTMRLRVPLALPRGSTAILRAPLQEQDRDTVVLVRLDWVEGQPAGR